MIRERTSDTLAVLRGLGARAITRAVARRALSTARALGRAAHAWSNPGAPSSSLKFVSALAIAPSPLAVQPSVPPTRGPITDETPGEDAGDPRAAWEASRGRHIVRLAAEVRLGPPGPDTLGRRKLERALDGWLDEVAIDDLTDPLEAAMRAWNLWIALAMIEPASLPGPLLAGAARTLVEHGRFLVDRLEDRGLVTGSHLVGELVGLYACGAALRGAGDEPAAWRHLARGGLSVAAAEQVLADGGGAEGSTGYGRFVAELWIAALMTARALGEEPPSGVEWAARQMLRWLEATLAVDGLDAGIGDDDDSRVLPGLAEGRDVASLVPLLSLWELGARLEGVPWSAEAGWLAGAGARDRWQQAPVVPWSAAHASRSFGLFVARHGGLGGDMVALRAGPHGQGGAGGHAHNDALSIAVWMDGVPVIIDPGTGIYLGRPALRDRFRGVAAHATVTIDGEEPSPIPATRPFALPDRTRARVRLLEDNGRVWHCVGDHRGYRHLGITHRREVRYERAGRRVIITDTLLGSGSHRIAISFPLAGSSAVLDGGGVRAGAVSLTGGEADADKPVAWSLDPGLSSPRYGRIVPSLVARRTGRVTVPVTLVTVIAA